MPRGHRVHHAHSRPGRDRPVSPRPHRAVPQQGGRGPGAAGGPGARPRCRDLPGRRPARLQHGRDGHAARAAGERRQQAARRGEPRDVLRPVAGVRGDRGPHRLHHQRRAPGHLGRDRDTGAGQPGCRGAEGRRELGLEPGRGPARGPDLGHPPHVALQPGRRRTEAAAGLLAPARGQRSGADLDRRGAGPGPADDRLRPPGAVLQAPHAHAARSGPAYRAAAGPQPADPDRDRRQGPPGRRGRQAADPADGPVHRRPAGAGPDRLPARLRHPDGALAGARLRRLAEQPAPPARGLRDLGDEGGAERRAEPVGARRLVGRVVRRRRRLGDPLRRRRAGPGPPGRAGSLGAVRPAQQLGGAAVLPPGRGRGAGRLGREDPAHAPGAGPARAGGAHGPRVRHRAVRPRHPVVPGAGRRRELPCRPRAGRVEAAGRDRLAAGAHRARRSGRGRAAARHAAHRARGGRAGRPHPG